MSATSAASAAFAEGTMMVPAPNRLASSAKGKHAVGRTQRPVQGELADEGGVSQAVEVYLPGRGEEGRGDREVKSRGCLAEAGRGKVDDDSSKRELEA